MRQFVLFALFIFSVSCQSQTTTEEAQPAEAKSSFQDIDVAAFQTVNE